MLELYDFNIFGNTTEHVHEMLDEIVSCRVYERFFNVSDGDIVVDIGANVGFFPFTLQHKKLKHVYCIEPSLKLCQTLEWNLQKMDNPHTVLVCGIAEKNGLVWTDSNLNDSRVPQVYGNGEFNSIFGITWETFIKGWNIPHINFLKVDCEGGEYDIFTEENYDFLTKKVKYIAGEFHLHDQKDPIQQWRNFYDLFLRNHPNCKVFEPMGGFLNWKDVTEQLKVETDADQKFYDYYESIGYGANYYVYMNNESTFAP